MRICRVLVLLPLLFFTPATTYAGPIKAGDTVILTDGPGNTGGGEFFMSVNGAASFVTFCLQRTQFITFNTPFKVGSVSGYADDAGGNDPLSSQTAWLYTQLRTNPSAIGYLHNQAQANLMQLAIWYFEGEITLTAAEILANNYIGKANAAVTGGFSGIGGVGVVNLLTMAGARAQDQLVLQQVPGSAALTLLGPGLLALVAFRRRLTRRA
jgi:hypothetical protein